MFTRRSTNFESIKSVKLSTKARFFYWVKHSKAVLNDFKSSVISIRGVRRSKHKEDEYRRADGKVKIYSYCISTNY